MGRVALMSANREIITGKGGWNVDNTDLITGMSVRSA